MFDWKAQLQEILQNLSRTHAKDPLAEVQRVLRGVLNAEEVSFRDRDGRELDAGTPLAQALDNLGLVSVRLRCRPGVGGAASSSSENNESRFREGSRAIENLSVDERYDLFLREFIRLEERHDFMWAGYVVRELLPRLGFPADEAKLVLDHLRAENLVKITKVPNPKNPEFPATGVQLNHEHPRVKAALESCRAPQAALAGEASRSVEEETEARGASED